jgi:DNA-binding CsgD family transcriptional regulator
VSEHRTASSASRRPRLDPVQLQPLGLDGLAERIYAHLLRTRCASARDLARVLRAELGKVERALAELSGAGLLRASPSDVPGYVAGAGVGPSGVAELRYAAQPPMPSLGPELRDRVIQLVGAGAAIEELGDLYAAKPGPADGEDEAAAVVTGFPAVDRSAHDLVTSARRELLTLDRQPFVRSDRRTGLPAAMFDVLHRGVDVRTIYAADVFRVAGYAGYMAELARLGERARMLANLPMRFIVADRAAAMLPLDADGPWVCAALVVRGRALVADLVRTFEDLWDRAERGEPAVPAGPAGPAGDPEVSDYEVGLLRMLADDMTEGAIGRHVGASTRTVGRRLARLQSKLGAHNRFAMGVEAARRGLV